MIKKSIQTISSQEELKYKELKAGIWIYFYLLLFEGALRKWVLPEFANAILIIRDPVAIYLLAMAQRRGILYSNKLLAYFFIIVGLTFSTTMILGHQNILVCLYGLRILILHFPLIFLIGKVFTSEDVLKMGRTLMWISLPMTALVAAQFFSPQSAFVNRGIGGDFAGAGFSGALGFLRPPATFSFTSGTTSFYSMVACFIFYFWMRPNQIKRVLLVSSTIMLLIAIPLSISRSLLFQVIICFIFMFVAISFNIRNINRAFTLLIGILVIILSLSMLDFYSIGLEAFSTRMERANDAEGGIESVLIDRYLGGLVNALLNSPNQPFTGFGLGYGTNVGSMLLTHNRQFLISEGEWGRLIGESGPILGIFIIIIRLNITARIGLMAWKFLKKNNLLPCILFSYGIMILPQGGWSQPTNLGFCTLMGGLLIASFRNPKTTSTPFPLQGVN